MSFPAVGYLIDSSRTEAEIKLAWEEWLAYNKTQLGGTDISELTLNASGAITITNAMHTVDTYSDAASDDLSNVTATGFDAGFVIIIGAENTARTVVVKDQATGAGEIHTLDGNDITIDDIDKFVILRYDGTDWYEVGRLGSWFTTETDVINYAIILG